MSTDLEIVQAAAEADRQSLADAMINSEVLSADVRAEAKTQGTTQREPFLMFADAALDWMSDRVAEIRADQDRKTRAEIAAAITTEIDAIAEDAAPLASDELGAYEALKQARRIVRECR